MLMLTITAAAAHAGCSRRYVERLLKNRVWQRFFALTEGGQINAVALADHCRDVRGMRQPGRPMGLRFLFRLPPSKKRREVRKDDAWRVDRALRLVKLIKDADGLQMIADALARQGITPAGSPKI
jgi:hypothetical protein